VPAEIDLMGGKVEAVVGGKVVAADRAGQRPSRCPARHPALPCGDAFAVGETIIFPFQTLLYTRGNPPFASPFCNTLLDSALVRGVAALVIMFMYFRVNIVIQWMPYASISF
jgi:hypothetical protein